MVHPESIPSFLDLQNIQNIQPSPFSSIYEVDHLVLQILRDVSQEGRYTGPGCIQDELFQRFPAVFTFLCDIGRNPDTIPRLMEHKRHIQHVNTQLRAYAATHDVITLRDMEQLVQAELPGSFTLLGPIESLPTVLEICQTRRLDSRVIEAFRRGHIPSRLCMTNEEVLELLYDCVCKTDSVFQAV
ncbi:E3 ubiquitin-protein ligase Hakai [Fasciola hepatica]|uniref:E3 ubiquitin-protein ligase Hakai n=1 Tax=Fasciola hepatica TaxID=6192 RepID=A0A2H1BTQ9_FASHE|nr:E3 ubiquitin-protein ligase Hakai [Fasciola hepatica]